MSRFGCNEFFNGYFSLYIYNLFSIVAFSVDMGYLVVSVRFTIILRTHIEWPDAFFLQQLFGSAFLISSVKGLHPRKIFKRIALLEARLKQLQRDDPIAWQVSKDNGGVEDMEQSILSCITYHKWCRSWQVQQSAYRFLKFLQHHWSISMKQMFSGCSRMIFTALHCLGYVIWFIFKKKTGETLSLRSKISWPKIATLTLQCNVQRWMMFNVITKLDC